MERDFSGIILAGGHSSRMGRDKAELELGGRSFLRGQIEKLQRLGIRDILVSGYPGPVAGARCVPDVYPHRGPLSGLHAGLLAIRHDSALVLAVDTPLVPESLLRQLLERHSSGITAAAWGDEAEPLIAVYDRSLAPACERLLQGEKAAVHRLLREAGVSRVDFTGDPRLLLNCNTPEDYQRIRAYKG